MAVAVGARYSLYLVCSILILLVIYHEYWCRGGGACRQEVKKERQQQGTAAAASVAKMPRPVGAVEKKGEKEQRKKAGCADGPTSEPNPRRIQKQTYARYLIELTIS